MDEQYEGETMTDYQRKPVEPTTTEESGLTTIYVDLDGTLAHYDGWKAPEDIGEPIPAMQGRVMKWLEEGHEVKIFTARLPQHWNHVEAWLKTHGFPALEITRTKGIDGAEFWDDRAVAVERNTGCSVHYEEIPGLKVKFQEHLELKAECERLKESLAAARADGEENGSIADSNYQKLQVANEEIDRLRKERDECKAEYERLKFSAENHLETLRSIADMDPERESEAMRQHALDALSGYVETSEATMFRMQEEVRTLREALDLLTSLSPNLIMDFDDPIGMAKRIHEDATEKMQACDKASKRADETAKALVEAHARVAGFESIFEDIRSDWEALRKTANDIASERDALRAELAELSKPEPDVEPSEGEVDSWDVESMIGSGSDAVFAVSTPSGSIGAFSDPEEAQAFCDAHKYEIDQWKARAASKLDENDLADQFRKGYEAGKADVVSKPDPGNDLVEPVPPDEELEKYWYWLEPKLKELFFLRPVTMAEAQAEFEAAEDVPISEERVKKIVKHATAGASHA